MFRDPRYLAPLGVLVAVIVVSAVAAQSGSGREYGVSLTPVVTVTSGDATPEPTRETTDARRLADLVDVRDALLTYRQRNGKFPVTKNGITKVCAASSDPGCVLAPAPFGDGDVPYWFLSDGAHVYLVAPAEVASFSAQCPPSLPPELTGVPLICLEFERPRL